MVTSGSLYGVMVSTLAQNARDVDLIPTLGAIFPIFITSTTPVIMKCRRLSPTGTTTRDYQTTKAYLEWTMKEGPSDNRKEFLQLSFRSRNPNGLLFFTESKTTLERCFLQVSLRQFKKIARYSHICISMSFESLEMF